MAQINVIWYLKVWGNLLKIWFGPKVGFSVWSDTSFSKQLIFIGWYIYIYITLGGKNPSKTLKDDNEHRALLKFLERRKQTRESLMNSVCIQTSPAKTTTLLPVVQVRRNLQTSSSCSSLLKLRDMRARCAWQAHRMNRSLHTLNKRLITRKARRVFTWMARKAGLPCHQSADYTHAHACQM